MSAVLVDTHAAVWYLQGKTDQLSATASATLDQAAAAGEAIHIASISFVEIRYLIDKGRLPEEAFDRLAAAVGNGQTAWRVVPLDLEIARALGRIPRDTVPDMPDRIIAATALTLNVPLVSRDRKIQASAIQTIW